MADYNYDIGTLTSTPVRKSGSIKITGGSNDISSDVYKFKVGSTSDINLALTKLGYGNYGNLSLYRDNGNGSFDSSDQLISSNYRLAYGDNDEAINTRVNAGTYFARVQRDGYSPSSNNVTYDLALSATSITGSNNVLAKEIVVGTLSKDLLYYGALNDDTYLGNTSDAYFFSLGSKAKVDITLSGLTNDADLRLIQDRNKNGIVDLGEIISTSAIRGTSSEKISGINLQGDYFLQVNQYNIGDTNYTLTFDYTGI